MGKLKKTVKRRVADLLGNPLAFGLSDFVVRRTMFPFIRVVGYHDTPKADIERLRAHFRWYKKNYVDCTREMLEAFLNDGKWEHDRPGIIVSFDDGLRTNFTVAKPLLEEAGLTGWFMVPAIVPELDPAIQRDFADEQLIPHSDEDPSERLFLSWDDIKAMAAAGHEISCHSYHHKRLGKALSPAELDEEIDAARDLLEQKLDFPVDSFAWVGGEEYSFSKGAFDKIRGNGFKLLFSGNCYPVRASQSPFFIERNHVDSGYSLNEVRLSVGGLYDLFYAGKRRRVSRLLTGADDQGREAA